MRRGVGGRERDGDDEARRGKSQQDEDDGLALPAGEERLEHQDAALAVRARFGDAVVHRQRAEERQQHEHERGERRQQPGRDERDARLIRESGEVVDAGEAHDPPPRGRVRRFGVRADRFGVGALEEPALERLFGRRGQRRSVQ